MSFVFIAILKSIFPVKPPAINLDLSNSFTFGISIPFNKILLGVMSEITFHVLPSKVFHVVLLSNETNPAINVSVGLVYKALIFSNLSTYMFLKLIVSNVSIRPVFRS